MGGTLPRKGMLKKPGNMMEWQSGMLLGSEAVATV